MPPGLQESSLNRYVESPGVASGLWGGGSGGGRERAPSSKALEEELLSILQGIVFLRTT